MATPVFSEVFVILYQVTRRHFAENCLLYVECRGKAKKKTACKVRHYIIPDSGNRLRCYECHVPLCSRRRVCSNVTYIHLFACMLTHSLIHLPPQAPFLLSTAIKAISLSYSLPSPLTQLLAQSAGTQSLSHGRTSLSLDARRTTRSTMIYRLSYRSFSTSASRWHCVLRVTQREDTHSYTKS